MGLSQCLIVMAGVTDFTVDLPDLRLDETGEFNPSVIVHSCVHSVAEEGEN